MKKTEQNDDDDGDDEILRHHQLSPRPICNSLQTNWYIHGCIE